MVSLSQLVSSALFAAMEDCNTASRHAALSLSAYVRSMFNMNGDAEPNSGVNQEISVCANLIFVFSIWYMEHPSPVYQIGKKGHVRIGVIR